MRMLSVLIAPCIVLAGCSALGNDDLSLSGRWNGTFGKDDVREVLLLTQDGGGHLHGASFFESKSKPRVEAVVGPGTGVIIGRVSGSQVVFTLTRDGMTFAWSGTLDHDRQRLSGGFEGYSNDSIYSRSAGPTRASGR